MGRKLSFSNRKKQNKTWLYNCLKKEFKAPRPANKSPLKLVISIPLHFNLKMLREALSTCNDLPRGWCLVDNTDTNIVLCYVETGNSIKPTILYTVTIDSHMIYTINALNTFIINLPKSFNISSTTDIINLLHYILTMSICPGNCDHKFQKLAEEKDMEFRDIHGKLF